MQAFILVLFEKYTTLLENQFKGRFEGVSGSHFFSSGGEELMILFRMFNETTTCLCAYPKRKEGTLR